MFTTHYKHCILSHGQDALFSKYLSLLNYGHVQEVSDNSPLSNCSIIKMRIVLLVNVDITFNAMNSNKSNWKNS